MVQSGEKKHTKKPTILIAASIYPPDPGGPAVHAKRLYEFLQKNGYSVSLVALAHYRSWPVGVRHILYAINLFFRAVSSDCIYTYDAFGAGLPAIIVSKILRKNNIVRVGGDIAWEREAEQEKTHLSMFEWYKVQSYKKNIAYSISRFVFEQTKHIIVPSRLLQDVYVTYYGIPVNKITVIPNPITDHGKDFLPSEQSKTIIFASRLVAYKNLSFVIASLARVLPLHPDIQFLIMGDGPKRKILEKEVKDYHLEEQVVFAGSISQDEVIRNTATCMFGIAPALTEFNPNYILECVAHGKPFLMSRENGLPFNVPDEFLFDPRNHQEFEKKITQFLDHEEYLRLQKIVSAIDFRMSWDDVFKRNIEEIVRLHNIT